METLKTALMCEECRIAYWSIPQESDPQAPVHCPECGGFLCFWSDILANYAQAGATDASHI